MDIAVLSRDAQSAEASATESMAFPAVIAERGKSSAALYYAINAELANKRLGTAATKGRSDVRGSNAKPWRQKGTGRARAGSRQSPIWRGGGTVFGPQRRSYRVDMPRKQRAVALCSALCQKAQDARLRVIDPIEISEPKTKLLHQTLRAYLEALHVGPKEYRAILIVVDDHDGIGAIRRAGKNIPYLAIQHYARLSSHALLRSDYVFLYRNALPSIASSMQSLFSAQETAA